MWTVSFVSLILAALAAAAPPHAPACPADPARQGHVRSLFLGDVDGDGAADRVFVRVAYRAPPRCALHLVVRRGRGRALVAGLSPPVLTRAGIRELRFPRVVSLASIDRRPGAEIVFTDDAGASTAFLGVFTVRRHELTRMRLPAGFRDVFPFSGGTYFGGADCVGGRRSGLVVSTTGEVGLRRISVERRFLRVTGTRFRVVETRRYSLRPGGVGRFPELAFGRAAFASCLVPRRR